MRRLVPLLPLALAACQAAETEPRVDVERGAALFAADCAACHGADGTGGVGPDLTAITARAGGEFPTMRVMAQIDGLGRHGDPDAVMPEFGAADMGPTVIVEQDGLGTPVPADLLALSEFLRAIQG
ncbi:putative bifunctional cbb3-type cytochrome c oxidase subunit II/cytochrome c [Jannaschia seosinensis]|uniref:Putative bifunctional cbb3-type cytochrome c oxidase subunit II/cytochrome c n=1 Tax=Jannaschia seosinensis TaxID=313367 RepID=A0A0M7BD77_9RHOB|nr:c-type cytochrome [Jannaschia seosinensis]CUH40351.1 putative bifunctional cbb3-type cytochrome c oxidase subunit II/cytochrome c [Jannaschia seosinensis]